MALTVSITQSLLIACSGFLIAVLWMDLIFDTQVRSAGSAGNVLPESVLASIAGYYHRATTTSRPMGHLIALVMAILLGALGFRAIGGHDSGWLLAISAVLTVPTILLALVHTVPSAVRLGNRLDGPAEQTRLARAIFRDHLACLAGMLPFLILWVAHASIG